MKSNMFGHLAKLHNGVPHKPALHAGQVQEGRVKPEHGMNVVRTHHGLNRGLQLAELWGGGDQQGV